MLHLGRSPPSCRVAKEGDDPIKLRGWIRESGGSLHFLSACEDFTEKHPTLLRDAAARTQRTGKDHFDKSALHLGIGKRATRPANLSGTRGQRGTSRTSSPRLRKLMLDFYEAKPP